MRYCLVALLVLGLALPLGAKQVVADKVGDTSVIQILDLIVSDKGPYEVTVEALNVPQAFSTEPIRLRITGLPCCTTAYAFIALNVAGTDIPVYIGHSFKDSALFLIPAPVGGWQVGTYPIKVIVSIGYNPFTIKDGKLTYIPPYYPSSCCLNIEVEQILSVVKSPPPPPSPCCPPPPPKPCCEIRWQPCYSCGVVIGIIGFLLLNWLICDP